MSSDDRLLKAVRELAKQASKETDPKKLHQLVVEINALLDTIEKRVTELSRTKQ